MLAPGIMFLPPAPAQGHLGSEPQDENSLSLPLKKKKVTTNIPNIFIPLIQNILYEDFMVILTQKSPESHPL